MYLPLVLGSKSVSCVFAGLVQSQASFKCRSLLKGIIRHGARTDTNDYDEGETRSVAFVDKPEEMKSRIETQQHPE